MAIYIVTKRVEAKTLNEAIRKERKLPVDSVEKVIVPPPEPRIGFKHENH